MHILVALVSDRTGQCSCFAHCLNKTDWTQFTTGSSDIRLIFFMRTKVRRTVDAPVIV